MKKIMLVLALVFSVGLFANASNGRIKKIDLVKKAPLKQVNPSPKSPLVQWMVTVTCGGHTYTACCYDTQMDAGVAGYGLVITQCH